MKMTLRNTITNEILVDRDYITLLKPYHMKYENNISVSVSSILTNQIQEYYYNDMVISIGKLHSKKEITVELITSKPYYEMHFCLDGYSQFYSTKANKAPKFTFNKGEHNIYCHKNLYGIYSTNDRNINNQYLEIIVSKEFVDRIIINYREIGLLFKSENQDFTTKLFNDNMPITSEMYNTIFQMCNCNKFGELKRSFLEIKAYELILLQLEQYNTLNTKNYISNKKEKESLQFAKYLIEQNLQSPLTLSELSSQVGMNDFKLKKEFKEEFNLTVFGYLYKLRMARAKAL
ncbi:hypothetical protein GJV76_14715 [Myroides sp. BIT-d1]|uniref:HTH araC/xylS-type domain-containing protein n=3 Tax=Myroides TaxID=76831 RepID=A0A6I3LL96_9FLAO|nr:AraC family transcriptional regulator [Myroides albus]MTG99358.1 hypothetical protein [Myroides albus]